MPVAVSAAPITTVAGPTTPGSSGRQLTPSAEIHSGVLDVWPDAITAPRATNPPRHRTTDRTCASGSSVASLRQWMPDQAVPAPGGTGVVKAGRPTGDARGEGLGC